MLLPITEWCGGPQGQVWGPTVTLPAPAERPRRASVCRACLPAQAARPPSSAPASSLPLGPLSAGSMLTQKPQKMSRSQVSLRVLCVCSRGEERGSS